MRGAEIERLSGGNPSEDDKSMVIRGSWCEGHLSVCRWEGGPADMTHRAANFISSTFTPTHFPRLPATRLLNITTCFTTEDGGGRSSDGGEEYNACRAAWRPLAWWQWQPPLPPCSLLARDQKLGKAEIRQASTHSESWSDVSKMAPPLSPILYNSLNPLSPTIASYCTLIFQFFTRNSNAVSKIF